MKKVLSIIMALCLIAAVFTACGSSKSNVKPSSSSSSMGDLATDFDSLDNVAYVMIYNPDIYNEKNQSNSKMNTGDFDQYVSPSLARGEDDSEPLLNTLSQADLQELNDKLHPDLSGSRASVEQPKFNIGDTKKFYYNNGGTSNVEGKFTCIKVGNNCCLWVLDGAEIDEEAANSFADEFDSVIYERDVELFGTPRYAEDGGKIHILFHDTQEGVLGYFLPGDLFTSEEVSDEEAETYGVNRDLAVIHINALAVQDKYLNTLYATGAHEFQHLINFTDAIEYNLQDQSSTWLNESMSGYAEEKIYPGIQEADGRYDCYTASAMVRHGQSLYNFDTDYPDIGVYGSVFLYSQYLENLAGEGVFKSVHDYWRNPTGDLTDAASLRSSMPSDVANDIGSKYDYGSGLTFASSDEEWLSKLTLDFYLSLMKYDETDPAAYEKLESQALLYDEVNPADIEGGGRVILATKDGKFSISANADRPLVYVGFDADLNQITVPIVK